VTNMQGMFHKAEAFNQDINAWDVQLVTSMSDMFSHAKAFKQPVCWTPAADTSNIFTGTGSGTKPAAAWGKLSARNNCEYDWLFLANRQDDSGKLMNWPSGFGSTAWVRYG
jgi:hypothetical protein